MYLVPRYKYLVLVVLDYKNWRSSTCYRCIVVNPDTRSTLEQHYSTRMYVLKIGLPGTMCVADGGILLRM